VSLVSPWRTNGKTLFWRVATQCKSEAGAARQLRDAHWKEVQNENLGYLIEQHPAEEDDEIATPNVTTVHVEGG
jgi:hypothetical protein